MKMVFPIKDGRVTTGFYDKRPYSVPVKERKRLHRGWDISSISADEILAPEDGVLFFHIIHRTGSDMVKDHSWFGKTWYLFSHFYYTSFGCATVLVGNESGLVYLFGHQDDDMFFNLLKSSHVAYRWRREGCSYNKWVRWILTLDRPKVVLAGDVVGYVGNAGYSTSDHVHMQIHASKGNYNSRIDPAELWPDVHISDNGDGPLTGVMPGSKRIPD